MLACVCAPAITRALPRAGLHADMKGSERAASLPVTRPPSTVTQTPAGAASPRVLTPVASGSPSSQQPSSLKAGVTLSELQEMVTRQHYQIVAKEKLLIAREQRLSELKQQQQTQTSELAVENRRMENLKECVSEQEAELRTLRARKGPMERNKVNNAALMSTVDSLRAAAAEKTRELAAATARLASLRGRAQELRAERGRKPSSAILLERDRLKLELSQYHSRIEEQKTLVCRQRECVSHRLTLLRDVNKRIVQLQERVERRRALNEQALVERAEQQQQRLEAKNINQTVVQAVKSQSFRGPSSARTHPVKKDHPGAKRTASSSWGVPTRLTVVQQQPEPGGPLHSLSRTPLERGNSLKEPSSTAHTYPQNTFSRAHGAKSQHSSTLNISPPTSDEEKRKNVMIDAPREQNELHVKHNRMNANRAKSNSFRTVEGSVNTIIKETSNNARNRKYCTVLNSTLEGKGTHEIIINGLTEDMKCVNMTEHIKNNNNFDFKNMNKIMGTRRKINAK